MAKHALVGNEAAGPRMIGIGTRRHGPGSAGLRVRIPAQREFDEGSGGRAMQIGPRMVARAQDVIDLHLFDVDFLSRQNRSASAADRIPHRAGSSSSECRTTRDRIRCGACSLRWCSPELGEKTTGPCRSGGSRRRSAGGTTRTRGRRRIRRPWSSGREPVAERATLPEPTASTVTAIRIKYPRSRLSSATQWLLYNARRIGQRP